MIVAVGRMKNGSERDLLDRYVNRAHTAGRSVGVTAVSIVETDESRARDVDQRRRDEAALIRSKLPSGAHVIVLDERGRSRSSTVLAQAVGAARDRGVPAFAFIVGGADGLAQDLLNGSETLAFGTSTFPHQLVRVLVAEQIYRVVTILAGHPYHRD